MTLLIVNDAELTIQFLIQKIQWKIYGISNVYSACSADEAKEVLCTEQIDIILCDIEMPGENGIELIRWVQEKHLDCDCIFLTCHANFDYIHEALHLDCKDYILFPTTAENIGNAVKKVIERRMERIRSDSLQAYGKQWVKMHHANIDSNTNGLYSSQAIIENTISYIIRNISSPELNVNEIAEKNYLSLSYLSRLFKKSKGISISQYIIQQRMDLAARLLEDDRNTVSNIALEVGYNNYPYFTSTFKKYFGCTPTQYREDHFKKGINQ
jgi:Response regulator containing CheY-like receiver domain and AraC-type DNA-binding domain